MDQKNALDGVDAILSRLKGQLNKDDLDNGWSLESQKAATDYFEGLREAIVTSSDLPPLGIVRGLDHWGVTGGALLIEIASFTNNLR